MARRFLGGIDLVNQLVTAIGAQMSTGKLLGRSTAGSGAIEEISIGSGLSLSGGTLSATGGGGGGLTKFTEAESTASPNATVYVDSLTAAATSTNADVAFVAKGTGATLAQVPTSTTAGGNKRGTYATDWQKARTAATEIASGTYSAISGGSGNTASGNYSSLSGGQNNYSTGQHAFVGGGMFNQATNTYSSVCGGYNNSATGPYSVVLGGHTNFDGGADSAVVCGGRFGHARGIAGYFCTPASVDPFNVGVSGVSQAGCLVLARQTTSNAATVLASTSSTAGSANQVILPNNAAYSFSGEVIAGVTGGGNTARWTISGAIKRGANAASTAMVGTPTVTMTHNDAGAAAWTVAVTADTTNGGISVTVTGAAATTIRWVCRINTTEMTF